MKKLLIGTIISFLMLSGTYAGESRDYLVETYGEKGAQYEKVIDSFIEKNKDDKDKLENLNKRVRIILSTYNFKSSTKDQQIKAVIAFFSEALSDYLGIERVETGDIISVHYTGRFENGEKFDSSYDRDATLDFKANTGQMIKGFDEGVIGMQVGDIRTIKILPADGYGEYDNTKTQTVEKSTLSSFEEAGYELKKGIKIPTQYGQIKILEVTDNEVTLDLNHELAGRTLMFTVELINIEK